MPPKKKGAAPPAKKQKKSSAPLDYDDLDVQEDEATASSSPAAPPPPIPSEPTKPIEQSYTYTSPIPSECSKVDPANPSIKVPCVLGVDEAGRGPVLGPLVYGIAYCPISYQDEMKQIGFADSKALTAERRDNLLSALIHHSQHLGWAVRVMSPQDISAGMLRRRPINLNAQSSQATVSLIAGVLQSGVDVTEIYVDTVGDPKSYSKLLSSHFPRHPHIKWTVTSKADAIYPIVGAASIAAKVTRDRCIEGWKYAEQHSTRHASAAPYNGQDEMDKGQQAKVLADSTNHTTSSPSHIDEQHKESKKRKPSSSLSSSSSVSNDEQNRNDIWSNLGPLGSGYPGDPNTVAFLKRTLDPVFGWPGIVRFSWATAKTMLEEKVKLPTSSTSTTATNTTSSASDPPPAPLGGKRLTRSLSRTSSFTHQSEPLPKSSSSATTASRATDVVDTRPTSLYGTVLPQPTIVGGTAPRGYKVKWIDEPVSISKFFGSTAKISNASSTSKKDLSSTIQHASSSSGGGVDGDVLFQVSALQSAINEWMTNEPIYRAKKAPSSSGEVVGGKKSSTIQVNVGKMVKDLGLTSADASFSL